MINRPLYFFPPLVALQNLHEKGWSAVWSTRVLFSDNKAKFQRLQELTGRKAQVVARLQELEQQQDEAKQRLQVLKEVFAKPINVPLCLQFVAHLRCCAAERTNEQDLRAEQQRVAAEIDEVEPEAGEGSSSRSVAELQQLGAQLQVCPFARVPSLARPSLYININRDVKGFRAEGDNFPYKQPFALVCKAEV